jgi:transposase
MLKSSYYIEPTEMDKMVFEKLIPRDHYLRQVKSVIDFERFREKVRECYSPDMGSPAEDPVRLIKLEFLEFQYSLSDRDVIEQAQVNVAFRFFLDLSLDSKLPVPSLLSQFRTRLGEERYKALFDEVVSQVRAKGLVKDRLRLKDATHVIANIAVPSTIELVAQTRERLLKAIKPYAPQRAVDEEAKAEQIRQATADLKDEERLLQRVAHLRGIVAWADELQRSLGGVPNPIDRIRERFDEALAVAHKVLSDRDDPKKPDQVRSVVDPEARRGKHGDYYDGYLLDISTDADSELITALNLLPGNGDEAADAQLLILSEEEAHGNDVAELSIDGVGWQGEVLRTLSDPDRLNLEVFVPPQPRPSDGDRFTPDDFTLDQTRYVLTCPAGESTSSRERNTNNSGWKFIFHRRLCKACELLSQCLPRLPKSKGRSVIKNDYQPEYDAAWQRSTTERYTQVRSLHPLVERKLSEIVCHHGGRKTRYRGRWRVNIQYLLTGMVVNIKRIVKLLSPTGPQPALQTV